MRETPLTIIRRPFRVARRAACATWVLGAVLCASATGQVNVPTYHNDAARSGQNLNETLLAPSNVSKSTFGKVFAVPVDGDVYAQPLVMSGIPTAQGIRNVLYVATEHDSVYAIDAALGTIYSQVSLIPPGGTTFNSSTGLTCGDLVPEVGITGTPVIDPSSNTMYVVAKATVNGTAVQYLHALDLTNNLAEKFQGPKLISASVPGTGYDSTVINGVSTVQFNAAKQNQRAALLLTNGHVVIGWGSHCDSDPWHGWVMSYNANTLSQEAAYNASANGSRNGVWMSGGGPAADSSGNIYFATGNGTWSASLGPSGTYVGDLGDSIVKLGPPANGSFPVLDYFTPYNQAILANQDNDVASGGVLLLPPANGKQLLVQQGKQGTIYLLNTATGSMGEYCINKVPACTNSDPQIVQEIMGASSGIWGSPAYWNGRLYWAGANDNLNAYSVTFNSNGTASISTSPASQTVQIFAFSAPTPAISANGTTNGILWALDGSADDSTCDGGGSYCLGLFAYDATNLKNLLYTSSQAANNRDSPGVAHKFQVPTIANGRVYVGTVGVVTAYGLFANPPSTYATSVSLVGIANVDATSSGSTPLNGGLDHQGDAYPSAALGSTISFAGSTFNLGAANALDAVSNITIPLPAGNYSMINLLGTGVNGNQPGQAFVVTYTDGTSTTITQSLSDWYTPQNYAGETKVLSVPYRITPSGNDNRTFWLYGYSLPVNSAKTLKSLTLPKNPNVVVLAVDVGNVAINYSGFASASGLTLAGSAAVSGGALVLTNGGNGQSAAAWSTTPVNVQNFTTDFTFQITPATAGTADGLTFTLQNAGANALGAGGGGLGYQGIGSSVAVKFDLYNNAGEGSDSTGLYVNGALPETPALDMTASGVNLHSGDILHAHLTYNGTTLTLTLTDTATGASFVASQAINIPASVGGTTAYVGFTAGTGGATATQQILSWTFASGLTPAISYSSGFSGASGLSLNGATITSGSPGALQLTDGGGGESRSAWSAAPVNVQLFATDFNFQITPASSNTADGFTFAIQNAGRNATGAPGGGLGYSGIGSSVGVKFDLYNNAGEGTDSTGFYVNGALPETPALDMTSSGVNLHSGHVMHAHLNYDGTTLFLTVTDTVTGASFAASNVINIPATVGGNSAYVGFTAGTGGLTAVEQILNWSYVVN